MSWSDDTRCLFCDGRLPLYRKITHGQFCSNAHRKSYWQDQELLAVERLSQTHDSLQAFRLAVTPEPVPYDDSEPVYVTAGEGGDPAVGTLVPQAWIAPVAVLPGMLAGDPLEYEMFTQPRRPSQTPAVIEMRPLPLAQMIRGWANLSASQWNGQPTAWELGGFTRDAVAPQRPKLELSPIDVKVVSAEAPSSPDRLEIPLFFRDFARLAVPAGEPFAPAVQLVTHIALPFAPVTDALLQLLDALSPCPDRLFPLAYVNARTGGVWLLGKQDAQPAVIRVEPMFVRGETILGVPVPSRAALLGIPVEGLGSGFRIYPVETRAVDARPEGPAAKFFVAGAAAKEFSLPVASSQLTFPVSEERQMLGADLEPFAAEVRATGIPVLAASIPARAGVPDAFTDLIELAYGKNAPLCGAATAASRPIHFFPQHPTPPPMIPQSRLQPDKFKPEGAATPASSGIESPLAPPVTAGKHPQVWTHAADFWRHAPRDLKLLMFAIPALIALVFHPSLPKVSLAASPTTTAVPSEFRKVLSDQWTNVRQSVLERAAIALDEDFRQGLDEWASPGGSTTSWSFDQTGFVRPGPLALYRPTVGLTDYQMQFLGTIDKKAISWVVRAADFDNYYVIKMEVLKPGPVPTIGIVRYAVIHGKAQNRVDTPVQISARADMLYRVLVDLHGDTFTLEVQGQTIDSWSEPRLARGGIGFFSARGEESRVRWVQVTHQYDMLGRLCAYLAPYNIPSSNGSWQP